MESSYHPLLMEEDLTITAQPRDIMAEIFSYPLSITTYLSLLETNKYFNTTARDLTKILYGEGLIPAAVILRIPSLIAAVDGLVISISDIQALESLAQQGTLVMATFDLTPLIAVTANKDSVFYEAIYTFISNYPFPSINECEFVVPLSFSFSFLAISDQNKVMLEITETTLALHNDLFLNPSQKTSSVSERFLPIISKIPIYVLEVALQDLARVNGKMKDLQCIDTFRFRFGEDYPITAGYFAASLNYLLGSKQVNSYYLTGVAPTENGYYSRLINYFLDNSVYLVEPQAHVIAFFPVTYDMVIAGNVKRIFPSLNDIYITVSSILDSDLTPIPDELLEQYNVIYLVNDSPGVDAVIDVFSQDIRANLVLIDWDAI